MHTISEVAHLLGISAHTLRYYEKEKIIYPNRELQTLMDVDEMLERKVEAYKSYTINRQKECYQ